MYRRKRDGQLIRQTSFLINTLGLASSFSWVTGCILVINSPTRHARISQSVGQKQPTYIVFSLSSKTYGRSIWAKTLCEGAADHPKILDFEIISREEHFDAITTSGYPHRIASPRISHSCRTRPISLPLPQAFSGPPYITPHTGAQSLVATLGHGHLVVPFLGVVPLVFRLAPRVCCVAFLISVSLSNAFRRKEA